MPKVSPKTFQTEKDNFSILIKEILGASAADEMVTLLATGRYKEIAKKGKYFSHRSKFRLLIKRPLFSICNMVDFLWGKSVQIVAELK